MNTQNQPSLAFFFFFWWSGGEREDGHVTEEAAAAHRRCSFDSLHGAGRRRKRVRRGEGDKRGGHARRGKSPRKEQSSLATFEVLLLLQTQLAHHGRIWQDRR